MAGKKPPTPAQQAHLAKLRQLHAERRETKARQGPSTAVAETAVLEPVAPESVAVADPDTDDLLGQLAAALQDTTATRAKKNERLRQLFDILGTLQPHDYPDLVQNPVILQFLEVMGERQAELHPTDPPGTYYGNGLGVTKKPWQWSDLRDMPLMTFVTNETVDVIYNGLGLRLPADEEVTVPKAFYDIYMERRRQLVTAQQHAEVMFKQRHIIDGRADPSVLAPSTSKVRAGGVGGESAGYRPGGGAFAMEEGEGGGETP